MYNNRNISEILDDSLPEVSKDIYSKACHDSVNISDIGNKKPTEKDYLQYFDYLLTCKIC